MLGIENLSMLARTLVLSRLLEPRDFGLMGMAFVAISTAEALSQTGFSRALVQRRDDPGPFMDTIWIVSAVRGILLALALAALSPLIAGFFRTPEATAVLSAVALIMVLRGLASPAWYLLEKDLKLARFAVPRTIGAGLDLVVTCVLAVVLRNVWAMVIGFLAGNVLMVIITYVVAPYAPRLRFEMARARQLYSFGKHVFRRELLVTFAQQIDRMAVGRLRDVSQLGLYTLALRLSTFPATALLNLVMRVVFPSFAIIQGEPERFRKALLRLMGLLAILSFPMAMGLMATAPELVPVVFGERWAPMTVTFQILCLLGAVYPLEYGCASVAGSMGRPDLAVRASLLRFVLMVVAIVPATRAFGIIGAAMVVASCALASTGYLLWSLGRAAGVNPGKYLPVFGIPALACAALAASVVAVRSVAPGLAPPLTLALLIVTGAGAYVVSVLLMDRFNGWSIAGSVLHAIKSR